MSTHTTATTDHQPEPTAEPDLATGMGWFDVPVEYPNRPKNRRRETLRILALDADTARREAEDDAWDRLQSENNDLRFPAPGADYIVHTPVTPVPARRASSHQDWIVVASINDRGDSHGTVKFGPYPSSTSAEADAQHGVLRHQKRLGYSAPGGEIVPIVRRMTADEAAHPQWLTRPETLADPPPRPGRYASAAAISATGTR